MDLVEIGNAVGKVDGKLDMIIKGLTTHVEQTDRRFELINTRVDKVDKRVSNLKYHWGYAAGGAAVITFIISNFGVVQSLAALFPK